MNRDLHALHLFEQAIDMSPHLRGDFLAEACRGDLSLRNEVDALLRALEEPAKLLPEQAASDTGTLSEGFLLDNRYSIVELLGVGGMGEVYCADDSRLDRQVAIKVMSRKSLVDAGMRERFHREAKAVANLSHPNIVMLYDLAECDGIQFAVMEYVKGKTLREIIEQERDINTTVSLARQVAAGLNSAHSLDVMHRDIKPENLIMADSGVAKILDFGLARLQTTGTTQDLTSEDVIPPGTLPYMSPEQVQGRTLTCSTDIFSLATTLCEAMTGVNPFHGETALETMQNVANVTPVSHLNWPAETPGAVIELVTSMWAKLPEDRPTAADVVYRLGELLRDSGTFEGRSPHVLNANRRTNLPTRPLKLTGREEETQMVLEALREHPLTTIVGPGGVGKTSLAVESARLAKQEFSGGIWLCEFALAEDDASVSEVLSAALDHSAGTTGAIDQIESRLRENPTLLVFDNCEHVIESVATLVERLLRAVPDLTVLATSREPLGVSEEFVTRIEGLSYAGVESSAVELFVRRASTPGGNWDADKKELAKQIVGRLEGLPLAIELAASQLSAMTLEELLEALNDQMETLQASRRSSGRQATVEQAIEWSFDLLAHEEQQLLLALSVFAGRFTAEAASRVADISSGVRRLLQRLVDQSMLARTEMSGESRFRLLEPIRQFCQSRIDREELQSISDRHARVFATRAAILGKGLYGEHEILCHQWLNVEWPDLRKAIAWGREHGDIAIAVDPLIAMDRAVWKQVRVEAYEWLSLAERRFGEEITNRADVLAMLATAKWVAGDAESAVGYLERSLAISPTSSALYLQLMTLSFQPGQYEEAISIIEKARLFVEEQADEQEQQWWSIPFISITLAPHVPNDPRIDIEFAKTQKRFANLDWPTGKAMLAMGLGNAACYRGDYTKAAHYLTEALELSRSCGNRAIEAIAGMMLGGLPENQDSRKQRLESAISHLRLMNEAGSESGDSSLYPVAVRTLIIALAGCECWEAAARCSGLLPLLAGFGQEGELSPSYPSAIQSVSDALGIEAFETLQAEGAQATPGDIIMWAEQTLSEMPEI